MRQCHAAKRHPAAVPSLRGLEREREREGSASEWPTDRARARDFRAALRERRHSTLPAQQWALGLAASSTARRGRLPPAPPAWSSPAALACSASAAASACGFSHAVALRRARSEA
mmetsp:Transcript_106012/g.287739  ORF Transcript_106012/g.287739 Transcript_106012/m.287739 type:complete len:115 (-) Transcript_106012:533-877(-)